MMKSPISALDDQVAWQSNLLTGGDGRALARVSIAGKTRLKLVVTDGGNGNASDHANWAGARVTGCGGAPANPITNLQVRDTANAADWSIQSNLQSGNQAFGDRAYTFASVPASVAGSAWVRPAADSKAYAGNPLLTFNIGAAADVYVALDDRRTPRPSWVDGTWVDTNENITMTENATTTRTFSLFRKRFNPGTVSIGPWGSTANLNFAIIVK
jgi:hypothetical protein